MMKSLEEWIQRYEEKTGDEFMLPAGFQLWWLPNRGFAQMRLYEDLVIVYQLCGDIHFWYDIACLIAMMNGAKAVSTISTVSIRPYLRLLHFKVKQTEEKEGKYRFLCEDMYGRKVVATYRSTDDTGADTYFVTSYMKERYEDG